MKKIYWIILILISSILVVYIFKKFTKFIKNNK